MNKLIDRSGFVESRIRFYIFYPAGQFTVPIISRIVLRRRAGHLIIDSEEKISIDLSLQRILIEITNLQIDPK
jgi:hypothetical protein